MIEAVELIEIKMSVLQAITYSWAENLDSDELKFKVLSDSDLESVIEASLETGDFIEQLFDEFEGEYLGWTLAMRIYFLNQENLDENFVSVLESEKIFDLTVEKDKLKFVNYINELLDILITNFESEFEFVTVFQVK